MATTIHAVPFGAILTFAGHTIAGKPFAARLELHVQRGAAWWVGDDGQRAPIVVGLA